MSPCVDATYSDAKKNYFKKHKSISEIEKLTAG